MMKEIVLAILGLGAYLLVVGVFVGIPAVMLIAACVWTLRFMGVAL